MNRGATLFILHMPKHAQNHFVPYPRSIRCPLVTYGRYAKAYAPLFAKGGFGLELGSPFNIHSTLIRTTHQLSEASLNAYSSSSSLCNLPLIDYSTESFRKKQVPLV